MSGRVAQTGKTRLCLDLPGCAGQFVHRPGDGRSSPIKQFLVVIEHLHTLIERQGVEGTFHVFASTKAGMKSATSAGLKPTAGSPTKRLIGTIAPASIKTIVQLL